MENLPKRPRASKEDRDFLKPFRIRCVDMLEDQNYDALALPQPWRTLYTIIHLDSEVGNGGFHQFFWNSEGKLNAATQEDLERVGATEFLNLFRRATATATEFQVVETRQRSGGDTDEFVAGYDTIPWKSLDETYYQTSPTLLEHAARYIRTHLSDFEGRI
jgi:hypothetical protein